MRDSGQKGAIAREAENLDTAVDNSTAWESDEESHREAENHDTAIPLVARTPTVNRSRGRPRKY
jgi:hypothetical protein